MKVSEAIEIMASTYQSLDSVASGLQVDAKEVAAELSKAKPDTIEFVVLTVLAKYNPVPKTTKSIENDNDSKQSGLT